MNSEQARSFGVFKPVGHVVVSLPDARRALAAVEALHQAGLLGDDVRYYSDREMLSQIEQDLSNASPMAAIGQELNLVKAHQVLAERGYHWLVVKVDGDDEAARVAAIVRRFDAERAQHYGRFIIEELIEHPDDLPQVSESPDRGLDAQTPSGLEAERTDKRS